MKNNIKLIVFLLLLSGCSIDEKNLTEQYKNEIYETEKAFARMAMADGMSAAFLHFAAEDAVLNRNGIIPGRDSIEAWFNSWDQTGLKLDWEPEFVDVSRSGDLGYTYGFYTLTRIDTTDQEVQSKGIFHTVWKRQPDGEWRYVWD